MSEFCKQCANDLFPPDMEGASDFAGLVSESDEAKGLVANVLCEGCGYIQVDAAGRCVSADCLEKHGARS